MALASPRLSSRRRRQTRTNTFRWRRGHRSRRQWILCEILSAPGERVIGENRTASLLTLLFFPHILWLLLFFLLAAWLHLSSASLPQSKNWTCGTDWRLFAIIGAACMWVCVFISVSKIDGHSCQVHTSYSLYAVSSLTWKRLSAPWLKLFLFGAAPGWDSLLPHTPTHKIEESFQFCAMNHERESKQEMCQRGSVTCVLTGWNMCQQKLNLIHLYLIC